MKKILRTDRLRRPPTQGFSWVDRRFMHNFSADLNRDAVYLYLFLAAVSDKAGLSYYRDSSIQSRTGIETQHIARARDELLHRDLIAFSAPLYQVLSLPIRSITPAVPLSLGDLMVTLAGKRKEGVAQ